jgi:hypothetical protein
VRIGREVRVALRPEVEAADVSFRHPAVRLGGDPKRRKEMKFLLLIQHFAPDLWEGFSEDEKAAIYGEYRAIAATPGVTPGLLMQPAQTATTVRMRNGKTLTTDGPFVAVKEALGGYLVFEADSLDAAIELAARIPQVRRGGAVEVRPVMEG